MGSHSGSLSGVGCSTSELAGWRLVSPSAAFGTQGVFAGCSDRSSRRLLAAVQLGTQGVVAGCSDRSCEHLPEGMKAAQQALRRVRAQKAGANRALHIALARRRRARHGPSRHSVNLQGRVVPPPVLRIQKCWLKHSEALYQGCREPPGPATNLSSAGAVAERLFDLR